MTSSKCVSTIENSMKAVPGVISISVTVADKMADVIYDSVVTTQEDVRANVADLGYDVTVWSDSTRGIHYIAYPSLIIFISDGYNLNLNINLIY